MQVIVHPRSRSPLRAEANIAACRHHGRRPLTFNGTSFPSLCSVAVCNEDRPSSLGSIKRSFFQTRMHSHISRAPTDVCRQVANNPGTFADNPGRSPGFFSANSGRRTCLFAGATVYVCKLPQLATRVGGHWEVKPHLAAWGELVNVARHFPVGG